MFAFNFDFPAGFDASYSFSTTLPGAWPSNPSLHDNENNEPRKSFNTESTSSTGSFVENDREEHVISRKTEYMYNITIPQPGLDHSIPSTVQEIPSDTEYPSEYSNEVAEQLTPSDPSHDPPSRQPASHRFSQQPSIRESVCSGSTEYWPPETRSNSSLSYSSESRNENEPTQHGYDSSQHSLDSFENAPPLDALSISGPEGFLAESYPLRHETVTDLSLESDTTNVSYHLSSTRSPQSTSTIMEVSSLVDRRRKPRAHSASVYDSSMTTSMERDHEEPTVDHSFSLDLPQPNGLNAWTLSLDRAFNIRECISHTSLPSVSESSTPSDLHQVTSSASSSISRDNQPDSGIFNTTPFEPGETPVSGPSTVSFPPPLSGTKPRKQEVKILLKTKMFYGKLKKLLTPKSPHPIPTNIPIYSIPKAEEPRPSESVKSNPPHSIDRRKLQSLDHPAASRGSPLVSPSKSSFLSRIRTISKPSSTTSSLNTAPRPSRPFTRWKETATSSEHTLNTSHNRTSLRASRRFSLPTAFSVPSLRRPNPARQDAAGAAL